MEKHQVAAGLRSLRLQAELSQRATAEKLEMKPQQWSRYERGQVLPDLATLLRVVKIFSKTLAEFEQIALEAAQNPHPDGDPIRLETARQQPTEPEVNALINSLEARLEVDDALFELTATASTPGLNETIIRALCDRVRLLEAQLAVGAPGAKEPGPIKADPLKPGPLETGPLESAPVD